MNILNKQELKRIFFNHLSDTYFKDFRNLYPKRTGKRNYFLMNDKIVTSDDTLRF